MFSTKETLKDKASDLFVDGLAKSVAEDIDQDAVTEAKTLPSASGKGVNTYSLSTLFLADRFYAKLGVGKFSGRVTVAWNGMDTFVFLPDKEHPFSYTTSKGKVIQPRTMDTDGGSIPRILRGLKKFSSWGYAPAFLIHDWLFTAKKCHFAPDDSWAFSETAMLMAEAMKTLMEAPFNDFDGKPLRLAKAEDTLYLMYKAVSSFIAEDLWHDDKTVFCRP